MTPVATLQSNSRLLGLSPAAITSVLAAARALERGRADEANLHLAGLIASFPEHPEVLRLFAGMQSLRGNATAAITALHRAIAQRPHDALYRNTLGATLIDVGDYDGAITTLRHACALDPGLVVARFNLGLALMRSMRVTESADALQRVLALDPEHATARVILGDMLRAQGRIDEAVAEYRRVLASQPQSGMAWWGLADLKMRYLNVDDIARLRESMRRNDTSDADFVAMGFALARALDDAGQCAAALEVLEQANARARRQRQWNAAAHAAAVDVVLNAFTPPPAVTDESLGSEVIFIVGQPRSGTTLIEQVLASHSQVEGAGELPDLPMVLTEESRRRGQPFPQWVPAMQMRDWQRLGRHYLERTMHWRKRRPRFTDKLPYNWFYIGAIRAMLPGARIIAGRRDPLETCVSCYRQHLAQNEYTRTFTDLGAFWRDFDRAMKHWCALYPRDVYENVYEELLADPERRIRELLDFCGLPFEPACFSFHAAARDVHTPSATQVREPLRHDTARAARYGDLLDPLRAALGMPPFSPGSR